jgi:hypothetical protein
MCYLLYLFHFYFVAEYRQRKCDLKISMHIIIPNDNLDLMFDSFKVPSYFVTVMIFSYF